MRGAAKDPEPGPEPLLCASADLVALLRAGDIEALDRVTRCYGDRLMAAARRVCRSDAEAQDAVQDATLAAWRYGVGFRGDGAVDRWLVRLVASACHRLHRGLANQAPHVVLETELAAEQPTPEMLAGRAELAAVLGEALLGLAPRDRAILILSDAQGWRGPEIAEALQMTPGSVRTRLSRLHAQLRVSLAPAVGR